MKDDTEAVARHVESVVVLVGKRGALLNATWVALLLTGLCWIVPSPATPYLLAATAIAVVVACAFASEISAHTGERGVWANALAVGALFLSCLLNVGVPESHPYRGQALVLGTGMLPLAMAFSFLAWRDTVAEGDRLRRERERILRSVVEQARREDN